MHLICDPAADDIVCKSVPQCTINAIPDAITQSNSKLVVTPALKEIGKVIWLKANDYLRHVRNNFLTVLRLLN
jgi:hypothetical protein